MVDMMAMMNDEYGYDVMCYDYNKMDMIGL